MAVTFALNCRSTLAYVTDVSPEALEDASTGWSNSPASANVDAGIDRRLAGYVSRENDGPSAVKSFTLPAIGTHLLRVALGDHATARDIQYLQIYDDWQHRLTLDLTDSPAGSFYDATGVLRTAAAWPTDNVPVPILFDTTTLVVKVGHPSAAVAGSYTTLAHLSLEPLEPTACISVHGGEFQLDLYAWGNLVYEIGLRNDSATETRRVDFDDGVTSGSVYAYPLDEGRLVQIVPLTLDTLAISATHTA